MLLSRGSLSVYVTRPISAWIMAACAILVLVQLYSYGMSVVRARRNPPEKSLPVEELLVE